MAKNKKTGKSGMISTGPVAENRRAKFDYEILDTVEAGIVLTGTEVKSLRRGKAQITDSYASPEEGEIWLINAFIPELAEANRLNHFERRKRKLLLNKREVNKLSGAVQKEGNTLVPLRLYFNDRGMAKLLLGLGKGKKQFDKRETQKQRDWNRQKQRLLKDHG